MKKIIKRKWVSIALAITMVMTIALCSCPMVFAADSSQSTAGQFEFNSSDDLAYADVSAGTVAVTNGKLVWEQSNSYAAMRARLDYTFENGKKYKIEYSYSMSRASGGDTNFPQLAFFYAQNVDTWQVVKNDDATHKIYGIDAGLWVGSAARTGTYTFTANIPKNGYNYMGIFAQPTYAGTLSIDYIRIIELNGQFEFNSTADLDYAFVSSGTTSVTNGKFVWEQSGSYTALRARLPYTFENGKKYKIEYSYSMTHATGNQSYPQLALFYAQNVDTWEVVKNSDATHKICNIDYQQWIGSGATRTGSYTFTANIPQNGYNYMGIFAQPSHAGTLSIDYIRIVELNGKFEFNSSAELDYAFAQSGTTASIENGKFVWEHSLTGSYSAVVRARFPYTFENGKNYKIEYSYSMTRLSGGETNLPKLSFFYAQNVDDWTVVKNTNASHKIYDVDAGLWIDSKTRTGKFIFTANIPESGYNYLGFFAQPAYAGTLSIDYIRVTEMSVPTTPSAPVISSQTQNSVTLEAVAGNEYRINGGAWQSSNVFTGLFVNTEYSFEQRVIETETSVTSAVSSATQYAIVLNGDANADKSINSLDLVLVCKYLLGTAMSDEYNIYGCDCNEDVIIDLRDLVGLKKKIANPYDYFQPLTALSSEYYPVFIDNFNGTELDVNNWTSVPHKAGLTFKDGHEVYMGYNTDLVTVENGVLELKMKKDTSGDTVKYYGSEIRMANKNDLSCGYIEMRAKLAQGTNLWNSFWATSANRNPVAGEIDIYETLGTQNLNGNMHLWWNTDGQYPSYLDETGHKDFELSNSQTNASGYHTYGLEWTTSEITWYIDGVKTHTVSLTGDVYDEFKSGDPMYLILSLSTGRSDTAVTDALLQETTVVDYIRIYQK